MCNNSNKFDLFEIISNSCFCSINQYILIRGFMSSPWISCVEGSKAKTRWDHTGDTQFTSMRHNRTCSKSIQVGERLHLTAVHPDGHQDSPRRLLTDVDGRLLLVSGQHPDLDVGPHQSGDGLWYAGLQPVLDGRGAQQHQVLRRARRHGVTMGGGETPAECEGIARWSKSIRLGPDLVPQQVQQLVCGSAGEPSCQRPIHHLCSRCFN